MPDITIRRVQGDELLTAYFPIVDFAFFATPNQTDYKEWLPWQEERTILTLFADGQPVATAGAIPMTQNVRGQILKMSGIAAVASLPQARRQGYVRQIMQAHFDLMRDQGQVVSTLYPFRESFYQRLGYVSYPQRRMVKFSPANLSRLLAQDIPGTVEFSSIEHSFDTYYRYLHEVQQQQHGLSIKPPITASQLKKNGMWLAVARHEEQIVGMMLYKVTGFRKEIRAFFFGFTSSIGRYLLLQWLARHVDQVSEIWLEVPGDMYVETWLTDLKVQINSAEPDGKRADPMGKIVLLEGLQGLQVGEGRFTARITDATCPWNDGIYEFDGQGGSLRIRRVTQADCDLTIEGLTALVYTGYDPADLEWRGWGKPDAATQQQMRQLFPPIVPFLYEGF